MAIDFSAVNTFITTKALPFLGAVAAKLPALLTSNEADFQAAVAAILKLIGDFQADVSTLVAAGKAAVTPPPPAA